MKLSGWGRYPVVNSKVYKYSSEEQLGTLIDEQKPIIAFGNGRSYGDSALSEKVVQMTPANRMLHFDKTEGLLTCEAGMLLSDILNTFLPRGWFLKITPGTKKITVGGAIASDVHGKNHHREGCFSDCVKEFKLMLPDGSVVFCSKDQNRVLFLATCGGMGLTGIILEATIKLKPVRSNTITQTTIKTGSLEETFRVFEEYNDVPYSVAWVDCFADGDSLGRSVVTTGSFNQDGDLSFQSSTKLTVPVIVPGFFLNKFSMKLFNNLYYHRTMDKISTDPVDVDRFFYPLDAIENWNRMYGKSGFVQYQFILPKDVSFDGILEMIRIIQKSKCYVSLGVLKLYGKENDNYLSFPMEGYSLALDFKIVPGLFELLDELDKKVLEFGGRIYLSKDGRVSREVFEAGYPHIDKFRALRNEYGMDRIFNSKQSKRLGL